MDRYKKVLAWIGSWLEQRGIFAYVVAIFLSATVLTELLLVPQSYWLTGHWINTDFVIIGFITPLLVSVVLALFSGIVMRHFIQMRHAIQKVKDEYEQRNRMLEKTHGVLEQQIIKRTEEQNVLLSLFDRGKPVLFKWENDEHWSISHVSKSVTELLGYEPGYFAGGSVPYDRFVHENDLPRVIREVRDAVEQKKEYFEHDLYRVITKEGDVRWVLDSTVVVRNSRGEVTHFVGTLSDMTVLKTKDQQLLQQSRMAQMGEMISMIAHQWRQPLGAIASHALDLKIKLELESYDLAEEEGRQRCQSYFKKRLDDIDGLVQNLSMTIDDFRTFYRPNRTLSQVYMSEICGKALNIVKASFDADGIEIIQNYENSVQVNVYLNEMVQVVLNILKNAQDNFRELKVAHPTVWLGCKHINGQVVAEICNNGGSIPDDVMPKIFDPYFTTKDEKNGTGLGLYMSKMIIEEHHKGKLQVANRDDGVCFIIHLKTAD